MSGNGQDYTFKVSPQVLAPLGLEQLQDPALAVLELIKNSWDADATRVWVEITQGRKPSIVVRDNGDGMSRADFRERWLVIGSSYKRGADVTRKSRPFIGEKGLGRLASYALGRQVKIQSASSKSGMVAEVDWEEFFRSSDVNSYKISVSPAHVKKGTQITILGLRNSWTETQSEYLATYTQFLTSIPGQNFKVSLRINGFDFPMGNPTETIAQIAEAEILMKVRPDGKPEIASCSVGGQDYSWVQFRDFKPSLHETRVAGMTLRLHFYRRDQAARRLGKVLQNSEISSILEQYQGVRIYRRGINVPPYGLRGDDWASLEKQRTATGGPTMVPGNSQLIGELHVPMSGDYLVITAGRSGFSNQQAVATLADYVRWTVRELGTARRAHELGLKPGSGSVPSRVDASQRRGGSIDREARKALAKIGKEPGLRSDPVLLERFEHAKDVVEETLEQTEVSLRLYAQLASTGIAATSFAHELRADFDVVSECVKELSSSKEIDAELLSLLNRSWARIKDFVALFRLLPVKVRRVRSVMTKAEIIKSIAGVSRLAPKERVKVVHDVPKISIKVVPAEFDAILMNLVSNSAKAIAESPQSDRGAISVALRASGPNLVVVVRDNGCGISDKVQKVMLEPLEGKFSEGTGMGLAIVSFIASRYRGHVEIESPIPSGFSASIKVVLKGVVV